MSKIDYWVSRSVSLLKDLPEDTPSSVIPTDMLRAWVDPEIGNYRETFRCFDVYVESFLYETPGRFISFKIYACLLCLYYLRHLDRMDGPEALTQSNITDYVRFQQQVRGILCLRDCGMSEPRVLLFDLSRYSENVGSLVGTGCLPDLSCEIAVCAEGAPAN